MWGVSFLTGIQIKSDMFFEIYVCLKYSLVIKTQLSGDSWTFS